MQNKEGVKFYLYKAKSEKHGLIVGMVYTCILNQTKNVNNEICMIGLRKTTIESDGTKSASRQKLFLSKKEAAKLFEYYKTIIKYRKIKSN